MAELYERLPTSFDIQKLREELAEVVRQFPPFMVTDHYGGWSALSSTGSYLDGWGNGQRAYDPGFMPGATMEEKRAALGLKEIAAYRQPTEICVGYIRQMLIGLRDAGFSPLRARFALLKSGGSTTLHRDAPAGSYAVRLHIPILTNGQCILESEGESVHLPSDGGGYLIRVDRLHQVFNRSTEDRIHFVAAVWDMNHVTKHHRYTRGTN
jgi:hypothetical protein